MTGCSIRSQGNTRMRCSTDRGLGRVEQRVTVPAWTRPLLDLGASFAQPRSELWVAAAPWRGASPRRCSAGHGDTPPVHRPALVPFSVPPEGPEIPRPGGKAAVEAGPDNRGRIVRPHEVHDHGQADAPTVGPEITEPTVPSEGVDGHGDRGPRAGAAADVVHVDRRRLTQALERTVSDLGRT